MNRSAAFLAGVAIGAGVMYVMDPERGNRRRALARDQVVSVAHTLGDTVGGVSKDVRNRAQGVAHEAKARVAEGEVPDTVLVERVRSELGRATSHPKAIEVSAHQGHVTLTGAVLATEVDRVVSAVSSVRGVKDVENRLDVHETADISSLQG